MIAQCKGKDLVKVPASKLIADGWYPSIKYDGNYVQIEKVGDIIKFWTSGGKRFYIDYIADELIELNKGIDFIIEAEYIANTDGKLGSRGKCTTTTYRTNYDKGIKNKHIIGHDKFKVFDCIYFDNPSGIRMTIFNQPFKIRKTLIPLLSLGNHIEPVSDFEKTFNINKIDAASVANEGWEGLFLIHEDHVYRPGSRVNSAIKLKERPTADLLCIGVKYSLINPSDIGSVILQDSHGKICSAGGLEHSLKRKDPSYFIGKIIEIKYEQILDTYIQPMFHCIREDKTKGE